MNRHKQLYLICGAVRSGKTTQLEKWVHTMEPVDGILAPVVAGERQLCHIASGQCRNLHKGVSALNRISVGRFVFNNDVFLWAHSVLRSLNPQARVIVVDEIGPLELAGRGLEPELSRLLETPRFGKAHFIFVVRDALKEKVLRHYASRFERVETLSPDELETINPVPDKFRQK